MSGHLLSGPYKGSVLQNDLESFLHVLLYIAIKYFKHNCPLADVDLFMSLFFDGATFTESSGWVSGGRKMLVMETGSLNLFCGMPFVFGDHKSYPMNVIIGQFLSWFKAYYAVERARRSNTEEALEGPYHQPCNELDPVMKKLVAMTKALERPAISPATYTSPLASDDNELLAANISNHDSMLGVFMSWFQIESIIFWPGDDRVNQDQE